MKRFSISLALLLIASLLLVSCTGKKPEENRTTANEPMQTQDAPTDKNQTKEPETEPAETTEKGGSVTPITPPGDISGGESQNSPASGNQNQSGGQGAGQSGNQSGNQSGSQGGSQSGNQSGNQPSDPNPEVPNTSSQTPPPTLSSPESEIIPRS